MKVLRFYILYRLPITLILIALGITAHYFDDLITAWILYIIS